MNIDNNVIVLKVATILSITIIFLLTKAMASSFRILSFGNASMTEWNHDLQLQVTTVVCEMLERSIQNVNYRNLIQNQN